MRMRARSCAAPDAADTDNDGLLEVGETWAYTAAHTVTQAEIDSNGGGDDMDNMATATGTGPAPDTDDATVPVAQSPGAEHRQGRRCRGRRRMWLARRINYTITVTNTGNATLTGVVVTDPNANAALDRARRRRGWRQRQDNLLEVGETWAYTAAHTVTQAELDSTAARDMVNMATVDSTRPVRTPTTRRCRWRRPRR